LEKQITVQLSPSWLQPKKTGKFLKTKAKKKYRKAAARKKSGAGRQKTAAKRHYTMVCLNLQPPTRLSQKICSVSLRKFIGCSRNRWCQFGASFC